MEIQKLVVGTVKILVCFFTQLLSDDHPEPFNVDEEDGMEVDGGVRTFFKYCQELW